MNATMDRVSEEIEFTQFVEFNPGEEATEAERATRGAKPVCAVRLGEPCMRLLTALLQDVDD